MIAYKAMGSELYKSALMEANKAHIYRYIFPANITLTIPGKDGKPITGLPPWKKGATVFGAGAEG